MIMETLTIPLDYWGGALLFIFGLIFGGVLILRKHRHTLSLFNSSVPVAGSWSGRENFFSSWDARCKIISLLAFSLCAVFTNTLYVLLGEVGVVFFVLFIAHIPIRLIWRRLLAVTPFLLFMVIFLMLTAPSGESNITIVFEYMGSISLNCEALETAMRLCIKAVIVVSIMPLIVDTSPYAVTVMALRSVGIPESISQMLLLGYRYIFVFRDEAARMYRSMVLRGFSPRTDMRTLRIIGSFVAMIFVRSYERTQRIHDAMVARGYRGAFPVTVEFKAAPRDVIITIFWISLGFLGMIIDWIWFG